MGGKKLRKDANTSNENKKVNFPQIHKNIKKKNEYTQMKKLNPLFATMETEFMRQKQENLWSFYGSYNKQIGRRWSHRQINY